MSNKVLLGILALSLFMRLYRIDDAVFGFDQNRDLVAMRKMAIEKRPAILGPKEDRERAKFFFGPYHYYYFFPSYLVARGDPIGPLVFAAMGGVLLTYVVYLTGTSFFNRSTGLIAAFIHAGSFFFSDWERQFTNPYHLPLLALGILYFLHKSIRENQWWIAPAFLLFGFAVQTHLAAVFLSPVFLFYVRRFSLMPLVCGVVLFLGTLAPLIVFDLRHDFLNSKLFLAAVSERSGKGEVNLLENFSVVFDYFTIAVARFFMPDPSHAMKTAVTWVIPVILLVTSWESFIIASIPLLYLIGYTITAGDIRTALTFTEISVHQFYVPAFALLLLISCVITQLVRIRSLKALLLLLLCSFLANQISLRLTHDNLLSYRNKLDAVDFIVAHASGKPFSVSVHDSVAYGFVDGFEYLFAYRDQGNVLDYMHPTYTISIPPLPHAKAKFGDIGITVP